ncbi:hypothetical protein [Streptomyces sp. NPDC047453]|uniref:hypothetical protein n=1 Tax=Streptomyces sp. NPDC047453 TaxID=3154812 RepID=UPI003410920A
MRRFESCRALEPANPTADHSGAAVRVGDETVVGAPVRLWRWHQSLEVKLS